MSSMTQSPALAGMGRNDQLFLGAGLLTFIFSFIAFAHVHVTGFGGVGGTSITAWHGIGVLAGLLVVVAVGVGIAALVAPAALAQVPLSPRTIAVAAAVLAFVFFVIRWLTLPNYSFGGFPAGYSLYWGGYVTLILNLVMIGGGMQAMRSAGESMPWERPGSATPPAAGAPPAV